MVHNLGWLRGKAIGLMESVKEQALDIVTLDLGDGTNAGPSFESRPVSA